jgi:hypothetical protein
MNIDFFANKLSTVVALTALLSCVTSRAADPASPALAPLAFLTAHEWEAKLPDSPDGKKKSIHARFTWTENRQAIRISNEFLIDGTPKPYIDGLYAWNPEKKAIVFVYVGAEGDLSEGTVRLVDGKLVHEFRQMRSADGKVEEYVARVTPHGNASWDNAIFRKGEMTTPLVQVQYLAIH